MLSEWVKQSSIQVNKIATKRLIVRGGRLFPCLSWNILNGTRAQETQYLVESSTRNEIHIITRKSSDFRKHIDSRKKSVFVPHTKLHSTFFLFSNDQYCQNHPKLFVCNRTNPAPWWINFGIVVSNTFIRKTNELWDKVQYNVKSTNHTTWYIFM